LHLQQKERKLKKYHKTLLSTTLFHGIDENDLEGMLACLNVMVRHYRKNDIILMAGSKATSVGVMVEGTAQITREDAEGNRAILSELVKGDIFAEAYAAAARDDIPITVIATSDCSIVWVPFSKVVVQCSFSCQFHQQLIQNMMKIIAEKSIAMNEKMRILSCKTTKEKLLTYLHDYSEKLTAILKNNNIKSVTVVRMEVPCCGGIQQATINALKNCDKMIPWQVVTISTDGRILEQ
jgi:CRP-like cAMP-binding protein